MSNRLNQQREQRLQPKRKDYAVQQLEAAGFEITQADETTVCFIFKGEKVTFYPYSGWHTGKTITDGRGFANLLKQLV